jgi:hypothetical protein
VPETTTAQGKRPEIELLSKAIHSMLKVHNYLDASRRSIEQQSGELGQTIPAGELIEDAVIMLTDIREEIEDLQCRLKYGEPNRLQPLSE